MFLTQINVNERSYWICQITNKQSKPIIWESVFIPTHLLPAGGGLLFPRIFLKFIQKKQMYTLMRNELW